MPDIFKSTDAQLIAASATFLSVATANTAILGYTPGDLATLGTLNTTYATGYNAMVTAREAAKGATQTKANARKALIADLRVLANKAYANPAVPSNLIAALGLPVHDKSRTPIIPVPPTNLVATGYENGETKLKWSRNGNGQGVVFQLEESTDNVTWTLFATITKASFVEQDQVPGEQKFYRVRAAAGEKVSAPSNVAVVYPSGGGGFQVVSSKAA